VLCGVGPGTPSLEAVRQAALVAAAGDLTLVAIGEDGAGAQWAEAAAFVLARRDGTEAKVIQIPAGPVMPSLLLLAGRHDLLVVGAHDVSSDRHDVTHDIVHQSPVPVLIARPPRPAAEVADRILVVGGESPEAAADADLALRLGAEHGSVLAGRRRITHPVRPADDWASLRQQAGNGEVLDAARRFGATLVVIGSRGLAGIAGLASVSAAVASDADCSVLVVRPSARAGRPPESRS